MMKSGVQQTQRTKMYVISAMKVSEDTNKTWQNF